jgi:hypothetical protein
MAVPGTPISAPSRGLGEMNLPIGVGFPSRVKSSTPAWLALAKADAVWLDDPKLMLWRPVDQNREGSFQD